MFNHPLPIEIVPFGYRATINRLKSLGFEGSLRKNTDFFISDNKNYIFDITLSSPLKNPEKTHLQLKQINGVIETGIFLQTSDIIIIGKK